MVKLLALVPVLVSLGSGDHRTAAETTPAERVAPTPYIGDTITKPASEAKDPETAARLKYAYAEIFRLRAQTAEVAGRLEESRNNFAGLDAAAKDHAAKIAAAEKRYDELQKRLAEQQARMIAAVAEKTEAEARVGGLKNSSDRVWVYCLLLGIACIALSFYTLSLRDSFRAIMARLPDKDKDDKIVELQSRLDESQVRRKRAGMMVNGLLKRIHLIELCLLETTEYSNGVKLLHEKRINELVDQLEKADRGTQEKTGRNAELEATVEDLRRSLIEANETVAAHNGGKDPSASALMPVAETSAPAVEAAAVPALDEASILAQAQRDAANIDAIEKSRQTMLGIGPAAPAPPPDDQPQ